jgi:hypothetical protein
MKAARLLLILFALATTASAGAAARSVSASEWTLSDPDATLRYTVPKIAAAALVKADRVVPSTAKVGEYVLSHISVAANGRSCPAVDQGYDLGLVNILSSSDDRYVFEIRLRCPRGSERITLRNDAFFDETASHLDTTRVQLKGGERSSRLLRSDSREVIVPTRGSLASTPPSVYFNLGAGRLLGSLEHLCFFIAVFLAAGGRREFSYVIAGLAGGYAAAAGLAATGYVELQQRPAEVFGTLLLVIAALLVIVKRTGATRGPAVAFAAAILCIAVVAAVVGNFSLALTLVGAGTFGACLVIIWSRLPMRPSLWLFPTAAFGLSDGFSLPSDFASLGSSFAVEGTDILAFNAGSFVAAVSALAVVAAVAVAVRVVGRRSPESQKLGPVAQDVAVATLIGLGACWMAGS